MAGAAKDVNKLLRVLEGDPHRCTVRRLRNGHWRVTREGFPSITVSRQPTDRHVIKNIEADVRRYLGITL